MHVKETILLIGTGKSGRLAANPLLAGDYKLLLCDKNFMQAQEMAQELNNTGYGCVAEAMECSFDCAWEADMILLAPAFEEQLDAARCIKAVVSQKILISLDDNANYNCNNKEEGISPNQRIDLLQQILPNTKIAVLNLVATACDTGLQTNIIEHLAVYGREKNTIDTVAEIFKNAGVASLKKALLPFTGSASQPAVIDSKC